MPSGTPSTSFTFHAATLARVHNILSFTAFASALAIGSALHYKKIVKNGVAGWPQEWFPSVSATIGDWYPERNIFQIFIALNSGPRFAVLLLTYLLTRRNFPSSALPNVLLVTGVIRTLSCGGWVYITSSDDHDAHDVLMILYIVCNIPWMWINTRLASGSARKRRVIMGSSFWLSMIPMIYFFIQHKVHRIPGAYTYYAFFEWSLILLDVGYDTVAEQEFRESDLEITLNMPLDSRAGQSNGQAHEIKKVAAQIAPSTSAMTAVNSAHVVEVEASSESESASLASYRPVFSFLADVYFSYQSWTLLTALPTTLFYFSVWKLALTGSELSTLATLSPIFLASSTVRSFAHSNLGCQLLVLIGAASGIGTWRAESVLTRLIGVAVGVMASVLKWAGEWEAGGEATGYHSTVFLLGLIVSSLTKHFNHGNNPGWPIVDEHTGGHQKYILAIASLSLLELMTRPSTSLSSTSAPEPSTPSKAKYDGVAQPKQSSSGHWFPPALALGALVFSLHERLTDASTLIAWSWTGYPLKGPAPRLHAPFTLLAQALGVLLVLHSSSAHPRSGKWLAHPLWHCIGAVSAYVLYAYRDWPGYIGGLANAVFLMSIAPHVIENAGAAARAHGAARVFTTAWLVWVVMLFTSTFTVAYAFVPGAWSFREHTDWILSAQVLLLGLAFDWRSILPGSLGRPARPSAPALPARTVKYTHVLLAMTSLLALLAPLTRPPPVVPASAPAHERARLVNAGIWTVHFGIDNAGRDSQRRMRNLIRDMQLDVVGLLETDLHRPVYGNRDLTRVMAEELGYYVDIGPGPNKHTWGAVLLSKFPILESTHHLLPSPHGELAPAIEAILDIYGRNVTVIVSHNGQEETPVDRQLQAMELGRIMAASYPEPVIFLGYVVTDPKAPRPAPYQYMIEDGRVHDIDDEDNDRWCEYIFYRGVYRTAYARVSRSTITDTELQIGQFVVPRYGHPIVNDTREDRSLRAWREDLPVEHWFPDEYYRNSKHPDGVRGHFYHVFDTPLYYKIPEGAVY